VLGLREIEKPESLKTNGGAWFKIGSMELHVSPEDLRPDNLTSKRHVCFKTANLAAFRSHLMAHGVEVIEDRQPVADWIRFYVRDPGGNRIEIAQRLES
jgi:catechol 2,3-dioxygenase-like lactoylglutathione lyase family enzyme